jgi:hypothetical protein
MRKAEARIPRVIPIAVLEPPCVDEHRHRRAS